MCFNEKQAVKEKQTCQCKMGAYSFKIILNFDYLFTALAMKRCEMGEETSKITCRNKNKN